MSSITPIDINKYRFDKKANAISILSTKRTEDGFPRINHEWLISYNNQEDLISQIDKFMEWHNKEYGQGYENHEKSHIVDFGPDQYDVYTIEYNKEIDGDIHDFNIRIYTGDIPKNKKYLIKKAIIDAFAIKS